MMINYRILLACVSLWMVVAGCDPSPDNSNQTLTPVNVRMKIQNGAETTNDTLLSVSVTGFYIDRMSISADSSLLYDHWMQYDTITYLTIPGVEGRVRVFGQFASDAGGTTSVLYDDIQLDLSARITQFNVSARSTELRPGDAVSFELHSGERGRAEVSFGRYLEAYQLNEVGDGVFQKDFIIPDGINDDNVVAIGSFRDEVGNRAADQLSSTVFSIVGRPIRPRLVSSISLGGARCSDLYFRRDILFLSDQNHLMHLIDVFYPTAPRYVKSIQMGDWPGGMDANSSLMFVADGETGVAVVSLFPPESAEVIGRALIPKARDVTVTDNFAFAVSEFTGLWVLDARNWSRPELLANLGMMHYGEHVVRGDSILYVLGISGLATVSISDPLAPRLLSETTIFGPPNNLAYYDHRLYISTETFGVLVYDVSDAANPILEYSHSDLVPAYALYVYPPYLLISRGSSITIVNAAVPRSLPRIGEIRGLAGVRCMTVNQNEIYAAGDGWFYVCDFFDAE